MSEHRFGHNMAPGEQGVIVVLCICFLARNEMDTVFQALIFLQMEQNPYLRFRQFVNIFLGLSRHRRTLSGSVSGSGSSYSGSSSRSRSRSSSASLSHSRSGSHKSRCKIAENTVHTTCPLLFNLDK